MNGMRLKRRFHVTVDGTICEQVLEQKRHIASSKMSVQAERTLKTTTENNKTNTPANTHGTPPPLQTHTLLN